MIIVTGGAGFIGSVICAQLQIHNFKDIVVVDWLGKDDKWKNIAKRELHSIIVPEEIDSFINKHVDDIDAIVHMGAISTTTEKDVDLINKSNFELITPGEYIDKYPIMQECSPCRSSWGANRI